MTIYNKLVRDKIPEIIKSEGKNCRYRKLTNTEFKEALFDKLIEEAIELKEERNLEELIDIMEVIYYICRYHNWGASYVFTDDVYSKYEAKAKEKGRFENKIFLEEVL